MLLWSSIWSFLRVSQIYCFITSYPKKQATSKLTGIKTVIYYFMILLVGWVSLMLISFDLTLRLHSVGEFARAGHSWDPGGAGLLFQLQKLALAPL